MFQHALTLELEPEEEQPSRPCRPMINAGGVTEQRLWNSTGCKSTKLEVVIRVEIADDPSMCGGDARNVFGVCEY